MKIMHTSSFARSVILAGLVVFSAGSLASQEHVPKSVTSLGTDIISVEAGGYWSKDQVEGFFRAVVVASGTERVTHKLYLQWIKTTGDDGVYAVVASVPIDEITAEQTQASLIHTTRDKNAKFGKLRMTVTVDREHSQGAITYILTADGRAGEYELTKAN